eukprot:352196_1
MAAAHFKNEIYLFGGEWDVLQRVDYDITLDKTVDQGIYALSEDVHGFSNQFYTQIEHTLYFIDAGWRHVIMYDLATDNDFLDTLTNVPQNATYSSCLTSSTDLLFVTGHSTLFQIFNISSLQW